MTFMRSLVLILMVALLPLRMWAAEGMAVRMAVADAASSVAAPAGMAIAAEQAMPDDCPMLAKADPEGSKAAGAGDGGHCQACQLCAALPAPFISGLAEHALPGARPAAGLDRFASAVPERERKPPIS